MTKVIEYTKKLPAVVGSWPVQLPHCLRYAVVLVLAALLCACASTRLIQHGIQPEVKGTTPVSDIQVLYGEKVINFKGITRPGGGGGWNAPMPVPEAMTVKWTVDGERQEVVIPLSDKQSPFLLKNWILRFDAKRIEIFREEQTGPIDPVTHIQPRREVHVYP